MAELMLDADNKTSELMLNSKLISDKHTYSHILSDSYILPRSALDKLTKINDDELIVLEAAAGYGKSSFAAYWQKTVASKALWFNLIDEYNDPIALLKCLISYLKKHELVIHSNYRLNESCGWNSLIDYLELGVNHCSFVLDGLHNITNPDSLNLLWDWIKITAKGKKVRYCIASQSKVELPTALILNMKVRVITYETFALSVSETYEIAKQHSINLEIIENLCWELCDVTLGHPILINLWIKDSGYKTWTHPITPKCILTLNVTHWLKSLDIKCADDLKRQGWIQNGKMHPVVKAWLSVIGVHIPSDTTSLPAIIQVENALKAQQPKLVLQKIEDNLDELISYADYQRYLSWFDILEDKIIQKSPWVVAFYSWILGQVGMLERAESLMASAPIIRNSPVLSHLWLTLRASIARAKGEISNAIKLCHESRSMSDSMMSMSVYNAIVLGGAYMADYRVWEAEQAFSTAMGLAKEGNRPDLEALALYYRARLSQCQGQLRCAIRFLSASEGLLSNQQYQPPILAGRVGMYRGYLYWLQGKHEKAERLLQSSLSIATQTQDLYILQGFVVLSAIYRSRGELDSARFVLDRLEALMQQWKVSTIIYKYFLLTMRSLLQVDENKISLVQPRLDSLYQQSKTKEGIPTPECFPQLVGFIELNYARLKAHLGRIKEAVKILDFWVDRFEKTGLGFNQILVKTLRAQLRYQLGLRDLAITDLKQSLSSAEKEFCVMPFVELGEQVIHLAQQLILDHRWEDMLKLLVGNSQRSIEKPLAEFKGCNISRRELKVLGLMAEGMSNQEIAECLYISLNTVKTHARRINTKLSVKNRTQAILKAQKLALI